MLSMHHVNLTVAEGGLDAEGAFLVDVLGLRQMEPGVEVLPGRNHFQADGGFQIHLSIDPDHRASEVAHVAVVAGDGLPAIERRLTERGMSYKSLDEDTGRRLFFPDPAGNLWELRTV